MYHQTDLVCHTMKVKTPSEPPPKAQNVRPLSKLVKMYRRCLWAACSSQMNPHLIFQVFRLWRSMSCIMRNTPYIAQQTVKQAIPRCTFLVARVSRVTQIISVRSQPPPGKTGITTSRECPSTPVMLPCALHVYYISKMILASLCCSISINSTSNPAALPVNP